jgi:hypothetical protein
MSDDDVTSTDGHAEAVRMLRGSQADVKAAKNDGVTLLYTAAQLAWRGCQDAAGGQG